MSEKTLKTLLGALGGLVVLYGIVALATGRPADTGDAGPLADALRGLDGSNVDAVTIERDGETVTLERSGAAWTVDGRRADTARVAALWDALTEAGRAELVATNPANHDRMGVADDGARSVAFRRTGDAADPVRLLVGDAGPTRPSAYVRLPGRDEVYLLAGELGDLVSRETDDWRDRRVAAVDTATVAEVRVTRDGEGYTLRRGGGAAAAEDAGGWTVDDGEPADDAAIRDLLGALAMLEATGFAPDSVAPSEPDRTVTALSADGDTLAALRISTDDDFDIRVTVPDRDAVFNLASWRADRLTPERGEVVAGEDEATASGR